ncbi:EAL domain-containing response regulator [Paludibacterium yongneupense]|uniref:EAL domain-containing response regulator n=1 Tax=Paludibacterium yongneupense TaxID=400061 RepID=UPI000414950E|nr:EAL domain-containing response regulator [Paludibacterium yongneupense]
MPPFAIADILIVEDSLLHSQLAASLCLELGASEVREARDGQAGLERMRERLPELLLLDLEMPRLDGVQVLQHMARDNLRVPVIVTSGKDYMLISAVEQMGRELGLPILGGLKKPLRKQDLVDLLRRRWGHDALSAQAEDLCSDTEIRLALDSGQIIPYYQPKVTLDNGRLKGAEMLARWNHPDKGIIPPSRFIPVMEACGWVTELTLLMLEQGLKQWQEWARHGIRIPLSVNLSALSLKGDTLVPEIEARLRASRVPARYTIFEITETAVADNLAEAIGIAARLRLSGFGLSIDDFGTGFATLQQLTRFPFTELKIDQSLVTSVCEKPHLEVILNSIIELAQRMQLSTVAEGIETVADLEFMGMRGCSMGQGYHIARPMDAPRFGDWVKQHLAAIQPAQPR